MRALGGPLLCAPGMPLPKSVQSMPSSRDALLAARGVGIGQAYLPSWFFNEALQTDTVGPVRSPASSMKKSIQLIRLAREPWSQRHGDRA